jgi:hypothetical protein
VWVRRGALATSCPKSIITPYSKHAVELFSMRKHLRMVMHEEQFSAKEIDALAVLETEFQKELNYGAR